LAAHYLGLEGLVDPDTFSNLLQGRLPNGVEIHRGGSGRRGGTDLTFSAPKSVSMMTLIGCDDRLTEAHSLAISRTMAFTEKYAACRVTQDGGTERQTTGNFMVAQFDHHLSRACDPQLHTHCVVINATRRKDGEWRALDNEPIYRIKMLLGAFYRAELAREVQLLGYEIRQTHFDGRFELASFKDSQIRQFSQRSQAIEVWLRENKGLERKDAPAWDKKLVAVITRDRKTKVDKAFLYEDWQSRSHEHKIEYDVPHKNQGDLFVASELGLTTSFNEAIAHLSDRESVFTRESLWRTMLERGTGVATFDEINCVISSKLQSSELIQVNGQFTTPALQQLERDLLEIEVKGRYSVEPVLNNVDKGFDINLSSFSEGQKTAVKAILLSRNRIIGIQGRAGTGKTTLLQMAKKMAEEKGYKVYGVAPSSSAARELGKSGINSETRLYVKYSG
jgi:conjugative relaxase-like TrwC/TraI family protein